MDGFDLVDRKPLKKISGPPATPPRIAFGVALRVASESASLRTRHRRAQEQHGRVCIQWQSSKRMSLACPCTTREPWQPAGEPGVPAYLGYEPSVAIEELQLIKVDTRYTRWRYSVPQVAVGCGGVGSRTAMSST